MKIEKQIPNLENENTPAWNIWSHGVLLRQKCYLLVQYFVCFSNKNELLTHPRKKNFVFIEVAQNRFKLFLKLHFNSPSFCNLLWNDRDFQAFPVMIAICESGWLPWTDKQQDFHLGQLENVWVKPRTTDTQRGNSLPCTAKIQNQSQILCTAGAYFVCHIGPIFQISSIYAFIGCP